MTTAALEPATTTDVMAYRPHYLSAVAVDYCGQRYLVVERSPRVKDQQPLYAPIAEYLARNPHAVIYEEESRDTSMMGYRRVTRIYRIHN